MRGVELNIAAPPKHVTYKTVELTSPYVLKDAQGRGVVVGEPHIMTVDRHFSPVYRTCLEYFYQNTIPPTRPTGMFQRIRGLLEANLLAIANYHCSLYPGWTLDTEFPGYLIRLEQPAVLRVPYHLVPAFPDSTALNAVWTLSRRIKTTNDSVICLSGSGAILQSSILISDLDYCEYVSSPPDLVANGLLRQLGANNSIFVQKIRFDNSAWSNGSDFAEFRSALLRADPHNDQRSHGKIDYLVHPSPFRPMEASNLLIFCDNQWQSSAKTRTFAHQEAILSSVDIPPNSLGDPWEAGRYVNWLITMIDSYLSNGQPTKALKRTLSLSRLCFLPNITDRISHFIANSHELHEHELNEINAIETRITDYNIPGLSTWLSALSLAKSYLAVKLDAITVANGTVPRVDEFALEIADAIHKELGLGGRR